MAKKIQIPVSVELEGNTSKLNQVLSNLKDRFALFGRGQKVDPFSDIQKSLGKYRKALDKVQSFKLDTNNIEQYKKLIAQLGNAENDLAGKVGNVTKALEQSNQAWTKRQTDAQNEINAINQEIAKNYGRGKKTADEVAKMNMAELRQNAKVLTEDEAKDLKKLIAQRARYTAEVTKSKKTIKELEAAQSGENTATKQVEEALKQGKEVMGQYSARTLEAAAALQELEHESGLQMIKDRIKYYTSWIGIVSIARQQLQKILTTFKEVDKSLTSISMVSGISRDRLWGNIGQYNKLAQELGTTTTEVLEASKLYYQQGRDTDSVIKLTTQSLKLAAIAELDTATATNYLTAAINGYKLEASDAGMVTDTWANLAANAAVNVEELATSISKVASISQSVGMDLQTTSAFLTQMISTTREAPENLGTALKTIIARFSELKQSGAALEDGVDANRVETALKSVDIQLRDVTGQFRDFDDVILELSSKWDSLDRRSQRYIATIAA